MFHVKHSSPHILLINPWITDFAAYNFWIRPLGLLSVASLLRKCGFEETFIDCLNFPMKSKKYRDGKLYKTKIEKPLPLKHIPRNYGCYGIPEALLLERFSSIEKPDLIAVTSGMTYWYPGTFKVIEAAKKFFKNVPVILGGIYATLCYEHAVRNSGADIVFKGGNELELLEIISYLTNMEFRILQPESRIDKMVYPAFDLYPQLDYITILTSRGCPFHCSYCASSVLTKVFTRKDPSEVVEEIEYWTSRYPVKNIAFYDDALLIEPSQHIFPILKEVNKRGIRCNFHTPNGLHVKEIDIELADLLYRSQFKTIRLGFESSNELTQVETGGKVDNRDFENSVKNLRRAGYSSKEIGVYIIVGLPGQRVGEVEESISFVKEKGAKPILVEYSPIPGTPLFEKAKRVSKFDIQNEPLLQNNSILPCQWEGLTLEDFERLKERVNA
jgi:radical SAM superfamily enzyme YgiQ (UPF0313 family)